MFWGLQFRLKTAMILMNDLGVVPGPRQLGALGEASRLREVGGSQHDAAFQIFIDQFEDIYGRAEPHIRRTAVKRAHSHRRKAQLDGIRDRLDRLERRVTEEGRG